MTTDDERIAYAADELLSALTTPIKGIPSVIVKDRETTLLLIRTAFKAIWEAK